MISRNLSFKLFLGFCLLAICLSFGMSVVFLMFFGETDLNPFLEDSTSIYSKIFFGSYLISFIFYGLTFVLGLYIVFNAALSFFIQIYKDKQVFNKETKSISGLIHFFAWKETRQFLDGKR